MNFDYSSFKQDGYNKHNDPVGTIQGTFSNKPIECRAYKATNGGLNVAGFVGKYRTGSKLWPAHIFVSKDNSVACYFGFDSRSGKHQTSGTFFAPEQYFELAPPFLFHPVKHEERCHRCNEIFDGEEGDDCRHCELEFAIKYNY